MNTLIPVGERGPLAAIQNFLAQLIRYELVDAVVVPMRSVHGIVSPALVADPDLMARADPLAPVMGLNAAPLIGKVSSREPRGRVGAVVRSCEMRALVELVKVRQADLSDLLTIGVDCLGTLNVTDYASLQREIDEAMLAEQVLHAFSQTGSLGPWPAVELRVACQMCQRPAPSDTDVELKLFGADLAERVPISAPRDVVETLGLTAVGEGEDCARRSEILAGAVAKRTDARDARLSAIAERLHKEGIEGVFAACIRCHTCMTVCPACYCRICLFQSPTFEHEPRQYMNWAERKGACRLPADTMMFHLTRLNHMALSCVGCGMCTSACPADIPVAAVFRCVGQRLQALFEYEPGRNVEEPLPLITFQEDEWSEVGEE